MFSSLKIYGARIFSRYESFPISIIGGDETSVPICFASTPPLAETKDDIILPDFTVTTPLVVILDSRISFSILTLPQAVISA